MKERSFFKERIYPIVFMFLVTVVFITVVSGIHLGTREQVAINEKLYIREAVLYAADIDVPETAEEVTDVYNTRIEEVYGGPADEEVIYRTILGRGDTGGEGFVIIVRGAGLWGEIRTVLAFETDLETIKGIDFISQNETPGLGARITESWFKQQFRGKSLPLETVPEDTADEPNEVDAITGATATTNAVMSIVEDGAQRVRQLVE